MTLDLSDLYESRYFETNGLKLHYTEWNKAGKRTLLLIHGINVQLHTWDPLAARFCKDFRVISLDLRGHGDSDWARDGYAIDSFVSDIDALLREAGGAPCALIGHSLGARIAIAYAGEHPENLTHLLLSDSGPEMPKVTATAISNFIADTNNVRAFRSTEEAREHYRKVHGEWQPIFIDLHAEHQLRRNWAGKYVFKADPELFWVTKGAGRREIPYIWEMAAKADMPTLIMYGKKSEFFNDEILGRMLEIMPRSEAVSLDTGHYIPREDPDGFYAAAMDFLNRPAAKT